MSPDHDDYVEIRGGDYREIAEALKRFSPETCWIRLRLDRPDFLHVGSRADFPSGLQGLEIAYDGDTGVGFLPLLWPGAPPPPRIEEEDFKRVVEGFASKLSGVAFHLYWIFGPGHFMQFTPGGGWVFSPDG